MACKIAARKRQLSVRRSGQSEQSKWTRPAVMCDQNLSQAKQQQQEQQQADNNNNANGQLHTKRPSRASSALQAHQREKRIPFFSCFLDPRPLPPFPPPPFSIVIQIVNPFPASRDIL